MAPAVGKGGIQNSPPAPEGRKKMSHTLAGDSCIGQSATLKGLAHCGGRKRRHWKPCLRQPACAPEGRCCRTGLARAGECRTL